MPLEPLLPLDTRGMFRPVSGSLVTLLRGLPPGDWHDLLTLRSTAGDLGDLLSTYPVALLVREDA